MGDKLLSPAPDYATNVYNLTPAVYLHERKKKYEQRANNKHTINLTVYMAVNVCLKGTKMHLIFLQLGGPIICLYPL